MDLFAKGFSKTQIMILVMISFLGIYSSNAFASFADRDLIRVYYDRIDGSEVVTDLGSISSLLAAPGQSTVVAGSFGSINIDSPGSFAVYFAVDRVTNQLWASGSTTTPSVSGTSMTAISNFLVFPYSYKSKLSAQQGSLGGAINAATRLHTELSLSNLASNNTQALYYWSNGLTTVASEKIGQSLALITTNFDGSTTITALATPIPAAAWLLGSGLLGLAGIRRRR